MIIPCFKSLSKLRVISYIIRHSHAEFEVVGGHFKSLTNFVSHGDKALEIRVGSDGKVMIKSADSHETR